MSSSKYKSVDDVQPSAPYVPHVIPTNSVILPFDAPQQAAEHSFSNDYSNEEKICRCCHGTDPLSDLIAPCACTGSIKYVHRACLDHWRCVSSNPESFHRCDICKNPYVFREKVKSSNQTLLTFKFAALVLLDFSFVLIGWQLLVLVCMLVSYLAELATLPVLSIFPASWPPGLTFYVAGHLLFLFCLGTIGILIGTVKLIQSVFYGSSDSQSSYEYTYNSYPYYHSYWAMDFWIYWNFMYFNPWYSYGYHPGCYICYFPLNCSTPCCDGPNLGGCGSGCSGGDCGDNAAAVLLIILAVVVIIVILIGVVVGILFLIQIGSVILTRRLSILKKKHELIDYEVEDLQYRV